VAVHDLPKVRAWVRFPLLARLWQAGILVSRSKIMIIVHAVIGAAAGNYFGNFWYFFAGSIFPDVDHIYVLLRNKIFTTRKIIDSIRFEEKYSLRFKTKFFHSLLGAIVFSLPILLINKNGAIIFFISYLFHLFLDWFDYDEKYYLYPSNIKFRGVLPIFSKQEIFITLIFIFLLIFSIK
jgi:hypothetical protein